MVRFPRFERCAMLTRIGGAGQRHRRSGTLAAMTDRTIENAVRALYRAMLAHDIAALDGLLAEDCVYVHSTGVVETKAVFLQGVRDGLYEYELVRSASERIDTNGDMAVVFGVLDFRGGPRGLAHPPVQLITTLMWVRGGSGWRLTHRHATRIP